MMKVCYLTVFLVLLAGCATESSKPSVQPVHRNEPIALGSKVTEPIAFRGVILKIPAGSHFGTHYDGLLKNARYSYVWESEPGLGSQEFNAVTNEELKKDGYDVLGADNPLFDEGRSVKARYQLGGTIENLVFNTYGPFAGDCTESRVTVRWELFDTLKEQIIFSFTNTGNGWANRVTKRATFEAFRDSLRGLLANQAFVDLVAKTTNLVADASRQWADVIAIKATGCATGLSMPNDLEKALDAVVVIRVGATTGSGVLVSSEGYILTAAHVVSDVKEVVVKFRSGLTFTAEVLRLDTAQDIALVKIPGSGHHCLSLAIGQPAAIGSDVFAIGAPAGEELAFSVSKGVVSAYREKDGSQYIQTDASLNPGNSGGPLIGRGGLIEGIVSWKIGLTGYEGLAFGVPPSVVAQRLGINWE